MDNCYWGINQQYELTAVECKNAIVAFDKNNKPLPKEKQYYPKYFHFENDEFSMVYNLHRIIGSLIEKSKIFDLLDSYA